MVIIKREYLTFEQKDLLDPTFEIKSIEFENDILKLTGHILNENGISEVIYPVSIAVLKN